MEGERLDALDLPLMVGQNTDTNQTAFTVSIDAGPEAGVSTGIRRRPGRTIQVALHPQSKPQDLRRPAHLSVARPRWGMLKRAGTKPPWISRMAGLHPSGVICEIKIQMAPWPVCRSWRSTPLSTASTDLHRRSDRYRLENDGLWCAKRAKSPASSAISAPSATATSLMAVSMWRW